MSTPATELKACAGGCGQMVRGTWKRGHKARFEAHGSCLEAAMPGPDATDDDLDAWVDLGVVGPPPVQLQQTSAPRIPRIGPAADDEDWAEDAAAWVDLGDEITPDAPPGHVKDQPRAGRQQRPAAGHGKHQRVTVTVKRDIDAKLGLMLNIPGRVWAARDPICGGAFVQAEPEIRSAAVELICQSPDLIEFFMGAGGGFMLWLNLLVACQPVMMTIWMHHIAHSLQVGDDGQVYQQVDPARYAA